MKIKTENIETISRDDGYFDLILTHDDGSKTKCIKCCLTDIDLGPKNKLEYNDGLVVFSKGEKMKIKYLEHIVSEVVKRETYRDKIVEIYVYPSGAKGTLFDKEIDNYIYSIIRSKLANYNMAPRNGEDRWIGRFAFNVDNETYNVTFEREIFTDVVATDYK